MLSALVFRGVPDARLAELPVMQLRCLHFVAEHEGLRMHDLADGLEVKLPSVSQIVDRLVKRGLIARHADEHDRRVVRLGLTELARDIHFHATAERQGRMQAVAAELSTADLACATEGLKLLAEAAERVTGAERNPVQEIGARVDPVVEIIARRPDLRAAVEGSPSR